MLEDEQLNRILTTEGGPQYWVDRMITEANRRGGLDNITAIVVRIESVDSTTGEHPVAAAAAGQPS
jgi:protein phosphatase